jgi:hypothetical protein
VKQITDVLTDTEASELIEGLSLVEYLELPHASGSILNTPSMKHARAAYEKPQKTTDPMRKGSLADTLLFDYIVPTVRNGGGVPDGIKCWDDDFPVFEGTRRGKKWDEFHESHGDDYLNSYVERQDIVSMVTAIATDPAAAPYWRAGVAQTTLTVTEGGVLMKGRPDWVTDDFIVDMKTTARIDARSLSRTTFDLAYHWKMALYRRWWERCTKKRLGCVLIFVEQSEPYDVVVMPLNEAILGLAEEKALKRVAALKQCIEADYWPGVANGEPLELEIPSWEMEDVEWQE